VRPSFLHVTTFSAHEVYAGADNNWAVSNGPHWCDTPALQAKASLLWLPLLEHDYRTVHAALLIGLRHVSPEQVTSRLATFPVHDLLRLALTSGCSGYWVELALGWAAQVGLEPDLRRAVHALALDHTVPQSTRHRAKRLYYTGNV
jgi:hypothetical protein